MLSVVIATFRRRDTLKVTMQKLTHQTLPASEYEVIVVDDGSGDGTGEMVSACLAEVPFALRYFSHENRGPGATENRGIMEAHGDLVLLIADDIHLEPTALEAHMRFHHDHPEPHFAALGQVLQSPDLPQTVFQRNWDPFKYYEIEGEYELPYWKFWACQISLKRGFMLKAGLFREHKGAAHEDVELGYRLSQNGLRIFYYPQALAYHYHIETLEGAVKRAYERGLHWRFIEDYVPDPQIWVKYHILNARTVKYYYRTFRNLSKTSLPAADRSLPNLLSRQLLRWIAFNRLTVPYFWLKLLRKADNNPFVAKWVNPYFYRGAVFYHFVKGCRDQGIKRKRERVRMAPHAAGR